MAETGRSGERGLEDFLDRDSFIGVNECGCISAWMDRATATQRDINDFYRTMAKTKRGVQMANLADVRDKIGADCPHKEPGFRKEDIEALRKTEERYRKSREEGDYA